MLQPASLRAGVPPVPGERPSVAAAPDAPEVLDPHAARVGDDAQGGLVLRNEVPEAISRNPQATLTHGVALLAVAPTGDEALREAPRRLRVTHVEGGEEESVGDVDGVHVRNLARRRGGG